MAISKLKTRLPLNESGHLQPLADDPHRLSPETFLLRFFHAGRPRAKRMLDVLRARTAFLQATEIQVGPRKRVVKPFVLLLTVFVFGVPALITLNLKHSGEEGVEAQNHLQSVMTEMRTQDGIEWRLISGAMTWKAAQKDLNEGRQRAAVNLQGSVGQGLPDNTAAHIDNTTRSYFQKVDHEVQLIASGAKKEASEWDETQVDPAFNAVTTLLENQVGTLNLEAENAQKFGDLGVLLTVLLSLVMVSVVQSRRKRADVRSQAKQQSEARYRTLIDQSSDLVLVVDRSGRANYLSPSVERLLAPHDPNPVHLDDGGEAHLDADPDAFIAAVDPQDQARLSKVLETAIPGRVPAGEFRIAARRGISTFELTVQDLTADPSVEGLVLTGHDVTHRLALQHEMEHRALHDTLTGLPNRALLADRFEQALRGAERAGTSAGLLLLDLDRFKEVNDTFGHHYGDELLRQIGPRLAGVLRGVDTIARLGGDEFAVLLTDVHGVGDATSVAAALLAALAVPFHIEGVDMDVEASVGVVISGEHGQDAVTLMQHADIAMYVAKGQHLGVFAYDPSIDGHSATKLAMVGDLRRALDRDELVLYYQPKVSVSTGELVGAEALVRWQHPQHGLVFPDDFIPLAERTGLINPLTRYVLNAAMAQARAWLDAGRPLPIAVNLSARNLHDEDFAKLVGELLELHEVPPNLLKLEVTESAIMVDPVRARKTMEQLSALGFPLSIDDFGAGYTSLSQLTSMPISEIKIDRSFVMLMSQDPSSALIVSSVVELGHNLGMTLVAEGVETEDVLHELVDLGCDVAQGYHLSRPIPADAFDIWSAGRTITPVSAH
jgi:diguanylate cyclase (GGDEF)-like protein